MSSSLVVEITKSLTSLGSPTKATQLSRFFKTGKGEYGEGDKFIGLVVPDVRKIAKEYYMLATLSDIATLFRSPYHEVRLCALIMMVYKYKKAKSAQQKAIYKLYLANTTHINNWDLIDLTAPNIVGKYLLDHEPSQHRVLLALYPSGHPHQNSRKTGVSDVLIDSSRITFPLSPVLLRLAHSKSLWERRIAMLATFAYIGAGRFEETFAIAEILLYDKHDLIQKAVGWSLREVGKRVSKAKLREFLDTYAKTMPRTTLRYAIEHFELQERRHYMLLKTR